MSYIDSFRTNPHLAQMDAERRAMKSLAPEDDSPEAWLRRQLQLSAKYQQFLRDRAAGKAVKSFRQIFGGRRSDLK